MDNFVFKKSLGQNFLVDKNVIHKIVDNAKIDKDTLVIEVGPGSGAITEEIVPKSQYSLLYEIDDRLEQLIKDKLIDCDNYSLIVKDFLKANVKDELSKYKYSKLYVVANLPYYITSPIIMKFIDDDILPDRIIVMVQKEVAARLSAKKGTRDYGSLTVLLNYYYDITKLFDVSRYCFIPRPNVDSSVVCMELKKDRLSVNDVSFFKIFVRDCFAMKRKNLRNNLKNYDLVIISDILNKYGYSLDNRAEELSLEVFIDVSNALS